ncbi:hypothetical protein CK203_066101 [Vitis vinifera]|uniref:Uncharacterized protein n=1 Tax=Vitis vinifera TaxID=29760 RepID=A0A438G4C5_VITVI|nr:hypothetical protein CK203_066101 [Vitis vinifera]
MLSWDDGLHEMIVPDDNVRHGDTFAPFILWPEDVDVQVMTRSGMIAQVAPLVTRPFGGTDSLKSCLFSHRVLSVLLDNGSTLNVCLSHYCSPRLFTLDFGPSTQIVRAYDNAQRKVGAIPSSLHQKYCRNSHGDDDLLLTGFTFDEDDANMDLGQDEGSILFGIPFNYVVCPYTFSLADYFVRGSEIQPSVEEMGIDDSTVDELQYILHQIQMSDETSGASTYVTITPPSPYQASLFSLCLPYETIDYGLVIEPVDMIDGVVPHDEFSDEMDMLGISQFLDAIQREPFSPLELFGVSVIEIAEEDQTVLAPELPFCCSYY